MLANLETKKRYALDESSFRKLCLDSDISKCLNTPSNIRLFWNVCHIPDFQKIINDNYLLLLKNVFLTLVRNDFFLPENWIQQHVSKLEDYSGGIDELTKKIANIRTWTYISNQSNWIMNKQFWQEKTRTIENNLSDKLHEKLTNRFIDLSASYFVNMKKAGLTPDIKVTKDKSIILEGQIYGHIYGFNLELSNSIKSLSNFTHNHVKRTLRSMIKEKFKDFINAPSDSINLGNISSLDLKNKVQLYWGEEPIGILKKGENIFLPTTEVLDSEILEADQKQIISNKLQEWIDNKITTVLKPLKDNIQQEITSSDLRSITFNLFNFLGTMSVDNFIDDIKKLTDEKKSTISKLGIRIGVKFFFMPNFMKKNAIELNALLWRVFNNNNLSGKYPLPKDGRVSFESELTMPSDYWQAIGYLCINNFAVRIDVFERIFFLARKKIKSGPFLESFELMNPIGCNSTHLADLLKFCGFSSIIIGKEKRLFFYQNNKLKKQVTKNKKIKPLKVKNKKRELKEKKFDPDSPFAVLQKLL